MILTLRSARQYLVVLVVLFGCGAKEETNKNKAKSKSNGESKNNGESTNKNEAPPKPSQTPARSKADGGVASRKSTLWRFAEARLGKLPKRVTKAKGTWRIETGDKAGMLVLSQRGRNPNPFFNIALFDKRYKDVDLSVKMSPISGKLDQGGGLVWRAKDTANYYVARYNPLEDNYRLYKVVKGRRQMLASAKTSKGKRTGWQRVRIVATGDRIQCYLDGKKLIDHRDKTFSGSGYVGVWTKADAVTMFWQPTATARE